MCRMGKALVCWTGRAPYKLRRSCQEMGLQQVAPGEAGLQAPGVHDGEPEAAGGHGVAGGLLVLMKGDLDAGNAGHVAHLRDERWRRVAIARAMRPDMRSEQHDAVAVAPLAVDKLPAPLCVK